MCQYFVNKILGWSFSHHIHSTCHRLQQLYIVHQRSHKLQRTERKHETIQPHLSTIKNLTEPLTLVTKQLYVTPPLTEIAVIIDLSDTQVRCTKCHPKDACIILVSNASGPDSDLKRENIRNRSISCCK